MEKNIVTSREVQRNYRKLINRVKRTKQPLYLGARLKPEAVLLDVQTFEKLTANKKAQKTWQETKRTLDWIRSQGRQDVDLAKFVHEDRKRH